MSERCNKFDTITLYIEGPKKVRQKVVDQFVLWLTQDDPIFNLSDSEYRKSSLKFGFTLKPTFGTWDNTFLEEKPIAQALKEVLMLVQIKTFKLFRSR